MTKYEKSTLSALRAGNEEKDKLINRLTSDVVFLSHQVKKRKEFFYPEEHRENTTKRVLRIQEAK